MKNKCRNCVGIEKKSIEELYQINLDNPQKSFKIRYETCAFCGVTKQYIVNDEEVFNEYAR